MVRKVNGSHWPMNSGKSRWLALGLPGLGRLRGNDGRTGAIELQRALSERARLPGRDHARTSRNSPDARSMFRSGRSLLRISTAGRYKRGRSRRRRAVGQRGAVSSGRNEVRIYCTQIVVSGALAAPTVSCNGAAPEGRYGPGTTRLTCSSPTKPGALPAHTICAAMPLRVAFTGSWG